MPPARLSASEYEEILSRYLVPLLPGSEMGAIIYSTKRSEIVVEEDSHSLLISPDPDWPYYIRIVRMSYPFEKDDIRVATQFTRAFREKLVSTGQPFFRYLIEKCPQDAVAMTIQHRTMGDELIPSILELLKKWAAETYEGKRMAAAIGVDPSPDRSRISNVHLSEISDKDFVKVLSNGLDTLLVLSPSGHVVDHLDVTAPTSPRDEFAPLRYLSLAKWATGARVAFSLNRHGEILVFKHARLQFAFRRGLWSHFAHSAMIAKMAKSSKDRGLMMAVYASCLDISFSRSGACIAIVKGKRGAQRLKQYLNRIDVLKSALTKKTALLSHCAHCTFNKIPRLIREELAALDGAIILDLRGDIIAAGAIVRVKGGSEGGGRHAAARALSRLGLALKVSSDGGITAFTDRGTNANPEIAFEV